MSNPVSSAGGARRGEKCGIDGIVPGGYGSVVIDSTEKKETHRSLWRNAPFTDATDWHGFPFYHNMD